MQLHFDYTLDDYREANAAHTAAVQRRTRKGTFGPTLFAVAFVMTFGFMYLISDHASTNPGVGALVAILGAICAAGQFMLMLGSTTAAPPPTDSELLAHGTPYTGTPQRPVKPPRFHRRGLFGWILFIGLAVWIFLLLQRNQSVQSRSGLALPELERSWHPSPLVLFFIVFPWALLVGVYLFMLFHNRRLVRIMWEGQPWLHQPHTAHFSDQGLVISDVLTRHDHKWEAITHVRETPNLFVLYISSFGFHMVPKRAIATPADLDSIRALLRTKVAERSPKGFEVLPPPLPAVPNAGG